MAWIDVAIPPNGITGRQYFLIVGDDLWWLTYLDPFPGADLAAADRMAASFAPA